MTYKFVLNILQSPDDNRDFDANVQLTSLELCEEMCLETKIPPYLNYDKMLQPVRNQGSQGTCAAMAASTMKEWQEKIDYNLDEYMSPQFFYNNRSNLYDDNRKNDSGMYLRDVMKMLKTIGMCYERTYPYGKIEHRDKIEPEIYEEAKRHVIESYARVKSIHDLRKSLYVNGPCIVAIPVWNYGKRMWKKREGKDEKLLGGHAMCVTGYDKFGFFLRNSWGKSWNGNGYTKMLYEDFNLAWEFWTTVDAKTIPVPDDDDDDYDNEDDDYEPEPVPDDEEFILTNLEVKIRKDEDGLLCGTFKQFHR